jgi:hypothetical protein
LRPPARISAAALIEAGIVEAPLPAAPVVPDAATAERLQPTVSAPGGLPEE